MPDHLKLTDIGGSSRLTFGCGGLPADAAVFAAGREPNGYFWEGVAEYLTRDMPPQVEFDCEAGMFCATGDRAALGQLRERLQEYLDDPEMTAQLIRDAEASGFQFDD